MVDIGCGKGYLSLNLAKMSPGTNFTLIDGQQGNIDAVRKEALKCKLESNVKALDAQWITQDNYRDFLPSACGCLITGIHQCGDLSSNSVREFARN